MSPAETPDSPTPLHYGVKLNHEMVIRWIPPRGILPGTTPAEQGSHPLRPRVVYAQWAVTPQRPHVPQYPCFGAGLFYDAFRRYSTGFLPVGLLERPQWVELRPVGVLGLLFPT